MTLRIPNNWSPRDYQRPLWDYLEGGGKRALGVWHRRAGKDDVFLNWAAVSTFDRAATYWHCLPEYAQARKAIWNAVDANTGKRRIDQAFPHEIREATNDQEMFIRFKNGSTWQLIGSDRYDALVGGGVAGVTFSEYALCNPAAWGYIRPMVTENNGWAAFITTPRGRNHAHAMLKMAEKSKSWFSQVLRVTDTKALDPAQLEEGLAEYEALYGADAGGAMFRQEYYCDFTAAVLGAFWARELAQVRAEARIDPELEPIDAPVHTAWDLGVSDDTAIWFFQVVGGQVFILDFYQSHGVGVEHYAEVIDQKSEKYGWTTGTCFVPHDARVKEWGTGRTRVETMQSLGLSPEVVPIMRKIDSINAVRKTLPRCVFHSRCEEIGISALEDYRREWDQDKRMFKDKPYHGRESNAADAFQYLAAAWRTARAHVEEPAPMSPWTLEQARAAAGRQNKVIRL